MANLSTYLQSIIEKQAEQNEIELPAAANLPYRLYLEGRTRGVKSYPATLTLLYLLEGSCLVKVGEQELTLQAGNSLLVAKGYQILQQKAAVLVKIKLFDLSVAQMLQSLQAVTASEQRLIQSCQQDLTKRGFLFSPTSRIMRPAQEIEELVNEYLTHHVFAASLIQAALIQFLVYSLREGRFAMQKISQAKFAKNSLDDYIDAHFTDINLTQAAQHFGFNSNYFSNLVKKETGKSFVDHVDQRRMQEARQLLAQPDISLMEIVKRVGFSSKSFFYKKFNQYYGMTPAAMRKELFRQAKINLQ